MNGKRMNQACIGASVVGGLCLALLVSTSGAATIDFTGYSTGPLVGQGGSTPSGGVTTNSNWSGSAGIDVVASSIGTAGSETSASPSVSGRPGFVIGPGIGLTGLNNNNFWLSALINLTGNSNGFAGVEMYNAGTERFGIGINGFQSNKWAVFGASNYLVPSTIVATPNQTALLVMNYDSGTGNVQLWVDPDLTSTAPAPSAVGAAPGGVLTFDNVRIRAGNSFDIKADNIYVGNDSPFIPEPSTASLLLLGLANVIGGRRRK